MPRIMGSEEEQSLATPGWALSNCLRPRHAPRPKAASSRVHATKDIRARQGNRHLCRDCVPGDWRPGVGGWEVSGPQPLTPDPRPLFSRSAFRVAPDPLPRYNRSSPSGTRAAEGESATLSRMLKNSFTPRLLKKVQMSRGFAGRRAGYPPPGRVQARGVLTRTPQHRASARGTRPQDGSRQMGLFQQPAKRNIHGHISCRH